MVPLCETVQYLLGLGKVLVALVVEVDVQSVLETIHEVQIGALVLEVEQFEEVAEMAGTAALSSILIKQCVNSCQSARNLAQVFGQVYSGSLLAHDLGDHSLRCVAQGVSICLSSLFLRFL